MTISFACAGCGQEFNVSEDLIGKRGRCYKCSAAYVVPPESAPAPGKGSVYGFTKSLLGVQKKRPPRVKYPTLYEDRIVPRGRGKMFPLAILLLCLLGLTAYLHRDFLHSWFKEEVQELEQKVHGEHEPGQHPEAK